MRRTQTLVNRFRFPIDFGLRVDRIEWDEAGAVMGLIRWAQRYAEALCRREERSASLLR